MKTTFTNRTVFVLCLWLSLAAFTSCTTMQNITASDDRKAKAKTVQTKSTRNENVVKIYPDLVKRVMHVKSTEDRELDFFVFDASGAIVAHHKMAEKEHIRISDLKIGSYIYQVFDGDEMTDSGKMVFK
jgi:hypothetical protein